VVVPLGFGVRRAVVAGGHGQQAGQVEPSVRAGCKANVQKNWMRAHSCMATREKADSRMQEYIAWI